MSPSKSWPAQPAVPWPLLSSPMDGTGRQGELPTDLGHSDPLTWAPGQVNNVTYRFCFLCFLFFFSFPSSIHLTALLISDRKYTRYRQSIDLSASTFLPLCPLSKHLLNFHYISICSVYLSIFFKNHSCIYSTSIVYTYVFCLSSQVPTESICMKQCFARVRYSINYLATYLSNHLSTYLSIYLSTYLSIHLSICVLIYLPSLFPYRSLEKNGVSIM